MHCVHLLLLANPLTLSHVQTQVKSLMKCIRRKESSQGVKVHRQSPTTAIDFTQYSFTVLDHEMRVLEATLVSIKNALFASAEGNSPPFHTATSIATTTSSSSLTTTLSLQTLRNE